MAKINQGLPDVRFMTSDGNIKKPSIETNEEISCLVFDTSTYPSLFTKGYGKDNIKNIQEGDVIVVNSVDDLEDFGIVPFTAPEDGKQVEDVNFMYGIPHYHISEYYRGRVKPQRGSDGMLYVMFADCSKNFDAVSIVQNATGGIAYQIGVYTEQSLFDKEGSEDGKYALKLVTSLEEKAKELEEDHVPAVILLQANPSKISGVEGDDALKVNLDLIPDAIRKERSRVSLIIGQANHSSVRAIQKATPLNAPVGCLGIALGFASRALVCDSIAYVREFDMFGEKFQRAELGFGDLTKNPEGDFVSTNKFESFVRKASLDSLHNKGYIFPIKYAGKPNSIHFNSDKSLSSGDFDSIATNRVMFKTERLVREALLPFLNGTVTVSNVDGTLTAVSISDYTNEINRVLDPMVGAEISGKKVFIDPKQKISENDTLYIKYAILRKGKSAYIVVENGYTANTK